MNEVFLNHQDQTVQSLLQWDTSAIMLSLSTEVTSVPVPIVDVIELQNWGYNEDQKGKSKIRADLDPTTFTCWRSTNNN